MKILKSCGMLFLWLIPGLFIGLVVSVIVSQGYEVLSGYFPTVFPLYDVISESELHARQTARVSLAALFITLAISVYLSLRYSNQRFEYMIKMTDGEYAIPSGMRLYSSEFLIADLIGSLLIGTVISVPVYFIPKQFFATGTIPAELLLPIYSAVAERGPVLGAAIISFMLIFAHALVLYPALAYYRAKWLTGFAEA